MIFGKSKKALELADEHFTKVFDCYSTYLEFIKVYFQYGDSKEARELFVHIGKLEQEADDILADIIKQLQAGALLPSTRKQILEICCLVDKIADNAKKLSRRMVIEHVFFPEEFKQDLVDIAQNTKDQMQVLAGVIELLIDDWEKLIQDNSLLEEIRKYEKRIDKSERSIIERLFAMDIPLAEKLHAKQFISRMEDVSDLIEDIGDTIQIMLVFQKI